MKFPDNTFDYIINEAMLTMFSNKSKERALKEYLRVLKPGGLLLTHDIALVNNYEETRKQLSEAINISVFPLPHLCDRRQRQMCIRDRCISSSAE